ncbi:MAG TPA: pseudouridine synthase [Bacteroidota bacterium]|nr:pseudouridine synthase [Bacteroidota bacterium]
MGTRVILFYKPYGVLSQFTREGNWETLAAFGPFPKTVYPAGRLDAESEGLLLLTDDNRIKQKVTDPKYGHPRTYVAQVERVPDDEALERLKQGVMIEGKRTLPARVTLLEAAPDFPPRPVPIRYRKNVPTAWLELTITEGRNRQVRKMTASVGHPTLRLVRTGIGNLRLAGLAPGRWRDAMPGEVEELMTSPSPGKAYRPPSPTMSDSPLSKSKRVSRRSRK